MLPLNPIFSWLIDVSYINREGAILYQLLYFMKRDSSDLTLSWECTNFM